MVSPLMLLGFDDGSGEIVFKALCGRWAQGHAFGPTVA
jgi:hypothetical protein